MNDSKKSYKYIDTPLSFEWKPPRRPVLIAHGVHTIAVLSTGTLLGAFPAEAIVANGKKLARAFNAHDKLVSALDEIRLHGMPGQWEQRRAIEALDEINNP